MRAPSPVPSRPPAAPRARPASPHRAHARASARPRFWHASGSVRAPAAEAAASFAASEPARAPQSVGGFAERFHTFGLFWNETCMYTYVLLEGGAGEGERGGGASRRGRGGPAAQELRIVDLSDRIGGGFFSGPLGAGGPPAPSFRCGAELRARRGVAGRAAALCA